MIALKLARTPCCIQTSARRNLCGSLARMRRLRFDSQQLVDKGAQMPSARRTEPISARVQAGRT
eukprot:COSAG02_NODE_2159_length_9628_cov_7.080596_3_plen_64_part_00